MTRVSSLIGLGIALATSPAGFAADAPATVTEISCIRNETDGRVLVDATLWDARLRQLGYRLEDGAYVPYEVLSFVPQKSQDQVWTDGMCRMKLLPVAR